MNHEHPPTRFVPQPTRKRYRRALNMTTDTDFAKILERLETKIDGLEEKIDTKTDSLGEKIQSLDSRLARIEENTSNLSQQMNKQDNRIWGFIIVLFTTLLGFLGKVTLFPSK